MRCMHLKKKMEVILGDDSICLFVWLLFFLFVLCCFLVVVFFFFFSFFFSVVHYVATNIQLSDFISSLVPNAPPDNVRVLTLFLHCHLGDVGSSTRDIKEWNHHTV